MWIKICGNTTLEDAQLAASCGADAVGFVFAPSPRRVTPGAAARIIAHLPPTIEKYGVFVDAGFDEIVAAVNECGLTGVQLHSESDLAARLRDYFSQRAEGTQLKILRVVHYTPQIETRLEALRQDRAIDAVLVDTKTANAVGGTGVSFDWQGARHSFFSVGAHLRLIAAGGLRPENVAEAISTLQPWGVDVASGVEAAPGRKDPARLKQFIALARTAAAELLKPAEA
jgi:phosphoribosylanthranilate isomerase